MKSLSLLTSRFSATRLSISRPHRPFLVKNQRQQQSLISWRKTRCFDPTIQKRSFSQPSPPSSAPGLSRRGKLDLFLVLSGALGTWLYIQNSDWEGDVRDAKQRLISLASTHNQAQDTSLLPLPMRTYLQAVHPEGSEHTPLAFVYQSGEFHASQTWHSFTSTLFTLIDSPGFVWESHVDILKIPNRVLETYIDKKGDIITKAWGTIPLIQVEEEEPYILFWLAMAPLHPSSFLQNPDTNANKDRPLFTWNQIHDISSCSGQLYDSGEDVTFELEFEFFEDSNLLKTIRVTSTCLLQPWEASYDNYTKMNEFIVPRTIKVGKVYDGKVQLHLKVKNHQTKSVTA